VYLARFAVRAPEPVVVVAADGEGQAVAEEVDGAGFAVVGAVDAGLLLVFGRERAIDARDLIDLFLPAEAVGVELRKDAAGFVLGIGAGFVEAGGACVSKPRLRWAMTTSRRWSAAR